MAKQKLIVISQYELSIDVPKGAEMNTAEMLNCISSNYDIETYLCREITESFLEENKNEKFLLEDFFGLSERCKQFLINNCRYWIFENSYGFLVDKGLQRPVSRNPMALRYKDGEIINKDFYLGAQAVFFQSHIQRFQYFVNLGVYEERFISLDGNFWTDEIVDYIFDLKCQRDGYPCDPPLTKWAIIGGRPGLHEQLKGVEESISKAKELGLDYEVVPYGLSHKEFLYKLSQYKGLVWCPNVLETFGRVYVEAKAMGLEDISNSFISAKYTSWKENGFDFSCFKIFKMVGAATIIKSLDKKA